MQSRKHAPAADLLRALASAQPVSGEQLAEAMGVSRTAVWKQIRALRQLGLPIGARAGFGYQLPWPVEPLDPQRIAAHLQQPVGSIDVHWTTDSTQNLLAQDLPAVPDMAVVLAEFQTAGRGRRGQSWLTVPGGHIALSCLKRFDRGFSALSGLSIAVGVCVVRALESLGITGTGLAWPNDIVTPDGKLGGILVEVSGEYHGPCQAIIGVGLNIRLPSDWRGRIDQPASDLVTCLGGQTPDRNQLAARVIDQLAIGLAHFAQAGLADFREDFRRLDQLVGRRIRIHDPAAPVIATAAGIDHDGALLVNTPTGQQRITSSRHTIRLL